MFMRYWGGGVGHLTTRAATDFFKTDRHPLDYHIQQPQANIELDGVDLNSTEDPVSGGRDSVGSDEDDEGSGEESDSEQEEAEDEEEKGDEDSDSKDGEVDEIEQLGFAQLWDCVTHLYPLQSHML